MASPLQNRKAAVDLAAKGAPGSRIRRDPPPIARKTVVPDREEIDRRAVAVGIVTFALAIVVIVLAFGGWAGWSPSQYTVKLGDGTVTRQPGSE